MSAAFTNSGPLPAKPILCKRNKVLSSILSLFKIIPFILLFFIGAGYESENPRVGNTSVEFYTSKCQHLLRNRYKAVPIRYSTNQTVNDTLIDLLVSKFYKFRTYLPAWTTNFKPNADFKEIKGLLDNLKYVGLKPDRYGLSSLNHQYTIMSSQIDEEQKLESRINFEILTTKAAFRYIIEVSTGINNKDTSEYYRNYISSLPAFLNFALDNSNLKGSIEKIEPSFYQYAYLKNGLRILIDSIGLDTFMISNNNFVPEFDQVSTYLVKNGYLDEKMLGDTGKYKKAIARFQQYHGLNSTGELNKKTIRKFRKSTLSRYYQIALNLDRLRKSSITDQNFILVNIPEFKLKIVEKGKVINEHKVMVGKRHTPTPEISSEIRTIIANPYWTVPKSITFNEILPIVLKDSTYLKRNGFMVVDNYENTVSLENINWATANKDNFDYWIRQRYGRGNALGSLKFQFPNEHRIFIHDTQSKRLFEKEERAFSHGCIRLQNPAHLAKYLLENYYDDTEKIDISEVIRSKNRKSIILKNSVPIHLKYYTCSADELGLVYYFTDIYNRDEAEIKELFGIGLPM